MISRRILSIILATLVIGATTTVSDDNQIRLRPRRQYSYTVYYLCGTYPNQYMSYYPCPCVTCEPVCQIPCSTTTFCQAININYVCSNGCCTVGGYTPYPPITTPPSPPIPPYPLCDGREASAGYCHLGGVCPVGFICTSNNVCCRCAYGTSIGPCVNSQCPSNFQCNPNNECCPFQVGK